MGRCSTVVGSVAACTLLDGAGLRRLMSRVASEDMVVVDAIRYRDSAVTWLCVGVGDGTGWLTKLESKVQSLSSREEKREL